MTQTSTSGSHIVAPRRFTDCVGVSWTVYRISPPALLEGAVTLLPYADRRRGWLLFESEEGERRRLAHFPHDWTEISAFELERWCMRATRIEELPQRRRADGSGIPDAPVPPEHD